MTIELDSATAFECGACGECRDQGEPPDHFGITEYRWSDGVAMAPGVYRVARWPWRAPVGVGWPAWIIPGTAEWLAPIPPGFEDQGYGIGHLCRGCLPAVDRRWGPIMPRRHPSVPTVP